MAPVRVAEWTWACDRVLVATDGSAMSLPAVSWAARIAEDIPAALLVVHAYDTDVEEPSDAAARAADAREKVERCCAECGAVGVDIGCEACPGDARSVIRDAIGRWNPDLLVVGTRGGGGFPGLVLGSVTEWLAQVATLPLAVVPHTARRRTGGPILVGIDGSNHSRIALEWAIGLAGRLRRSLHAVYAVPWGTRDGEAALAPARPGMEAVREEIERARPIASTLHVGLDLTVAGVNPVTALTERAGADDTEAIVVGARGHGPFGELTIGRVPRQLLHAASRPVLIVPA